MSDLATALATTSQHTSRDCSQPQKTCLATTSQLTPRYYVSIGRRHLAGAAVMEGCFDVIVLDESHRALTGGVDKKSLWYRLETRAPPPFAPRLISEQKVAAIPKG